MLEVGIKIGSKCMCKYMCIRATLNFRLQNACASTGAYELPLNFNCENVSGKCCIVVVIQITYLSHFYLVVRFSFCFFNLFFI